MATFFDPDIFLNLDDGSGSGMTDTTNNAVTPFNLNLSPMIDFDYQDPILFTIPTPTIGKIPHFTIELGTNSNGSDSSLAPMAPIDKTSMAQTGGKNDKKRVIINLNNNKSQYPNGEVVEGLIQEIPSEEFKRKKEEGTLLLKMSQAQRKKNDPKLQFDLGSDKSLQVLLKLALKNKQSIQESMGRLTALFNETRDAIDDEQETLQEVMEELQKYQPQSLVQDNICDTLGRALYRQSRQKEALQLLLSAGEDLKENAEKGSDLFDKMQKKLAILNTPSTLNSSEKLAETDVKQKHDKEQAKTQQVVKMEFVDSKPSTLRFTMKRKADPLSSAITAGRQDGVSSLEGAPSSKRRKVASS